MFKAQVKGISRSRDVAGKDVPDTPNEFTRYLNNKNKHKVPIGNVVAHEIRKNMIKQVSPLYPYHPSSKWSKDKELRGWNQNDLNTYIIRESSKHAIEDFDRFILKTGSVSDALDTKERDKDKENKDKENKDNENKDKKEEQKAAKLSSLMAQRVGLPKQNGTPIKHYNQRHWINGQSNVDVRDNEHQLLKKTSMA